MARRRRYRDSWRASEASWCKYFFVFFFQAEDGIRDRDVTGVQTCALPICATGLSVERPENCGGVIEQALATPGPVLVEARSEERRVGKECRSRWAAEH